MRRRRQEPAITEQIKHVEERLHFIEAYVKVLAEPQAFLRITLEADTVEQALAAAQTQFGLDAIQARAVLDLQFRQIAQRNKIIVERNELAAHLTELRQMAAAPSTQPN